MTLLIEYQFNSKYQYEKDVLNSVSQVSQKVLVRKYFLRMLVGFWQWEKGLRVQALFLSSRVFLHKKQKEQAHHQFIGRKGEKGKKRRGGEGEVEGEGGGGGEEIHNHHHKRVSDRPWPRLLFPPTHSFVLWCNFGRT